MATFVPYASCYGNKQAVQLLGRNSYFSLFANPPCLISPRQRLACQAPEMTLRQITQLIRLLRQLNLRDSKGKQLPETQRDIKRPEKDADGLALECENASSPRRLWDLSPKAELNPAGPTGPFFVPCSPTPFAFQEPFQQLLHRITAVPEFRPPLPVLLPPQAQFWSTVCRWMNSWEVKWLTCGTLVSAQHLLGFFPLPKRIRPRPSRINCPNQLDNQVP